MVKMDKIAVIIPCYNESTTVGKVISDFKRELPDAVVYVYDNNSTDGTAEVAEKAGAVVRHEYRQGKGNVVRRMLREIDALCYVMVDGDDTYPAESAPEMVSMVLDRGADMVVGDRLSSTYYQENKRPFHNFGNSLVRSTINFLFSGGIKDIMTGYRAMGYNFAKTLPVKSGGFELETEMTIHAVSYNLDVRNVVIEYRDRPEGSTSKLNTFSDGARVLLTVFDLFKNNRPLMFFSWAGLIIFLISLFAFIFRVWIPYMETGLVEHFPTLIVCASAWALSALFFVCGLILDSVMRKEKREFEWRLAAAEQMKKRQAKESGLEC